MPTRILREGIITSERVNSLSLEAELLYRRLMSVVDDYGRFHANPTVVRAACFPLKVDLFTDRKIEALLDEVVNAGLVVKYSGGRYIAMLDFRQQTRTPSKFPQPLENELLIKCKANAKQMLSLVEGEGEGEDVGVAIATDDQNDRPLPPHKRITFSQHSQNIEGIQDQDISRWQEAYPAVDVHGEISRARQWLTANPSKKKSNVYRFITNWLSRSQERGGQNGRQPTQTPKKIEYYDGVL